MHPKHPQSRHRVLFGSLAFALLSWVLVSCGGGGGSGASAGNPPTISNFVLFSKGAYLNSGGGSTMVGGQLSFTTTGSPPTSATITTRDANGAVVSAQTIAITGPVGTSGTVAGSATVGTGVAGLFTVQIYLSDDAGDRSNVLSAPFKIAPFPWTSAAPMPAFRVNTAAVALGSSFYVIGGDDGLAPMTPKPLTSTVQVFDAIAGTWSAGVPLPITLDYPSAAVVNDKIYVVAGRTSTAPCSEISNVYLFDPALGSWTQRAAIPVPTFASTASVVGTKIYVVGGNVAGVCPDRPTAAVWIYDTTSDTWTTGADRPAATVQLGAGALNGKIEAFAGVFALGGGSGGVDSLAEYDPAADSWTPRNARIANAGMAVASVGGQLYAIGGLGASRALSAYDPGSDTVRFLEQLPAGAIVLGPVADSYNGMIYVFDANTTWVYTPANDIN
jgi:Kelch motif